MDQLPNEILGFILVRIPTASLMQLCCVSRRMNEFILGPVFAHMHLDYTKNLRGYRRILVVMGNQKRSRNEVNDNPGKRLSIRPFDHVDVEAAGGRVGPVDLPLPFPANFHVKLYGSCNGIVCMSHLSSYYLCNPCTRRFMALPEPSFSSHHATTSGMGLWFDPATENYLIIRLVCFARTFDLGLNTSSIYEDIEVSNLLCPNPSAPSSSSGGALGQGWPTLGAEIYDGNRNSWRKLDVILPHIEDRGSVSVLARRIFHWCTRDRKILAFDSVHRRFRQIAFPGDALAVRGPLSTWNAGVQDDSLAFIYLHAISVDVWVMEGYGTPKESWTRRYSTVIPLANIPVGIPSLACWNDGRLFMVGKIIPEVIAVPLQGEGHLVSYGSIYHTRSLYSLSYIEYEESFVSLGRIEGTQWQSMMTLPFP